MSFITPFGIFCYTKIAFGLKNGGDTYQKCIHIILEPQIERIVESYIDEVMVKSKKCGDLLDDFKETFKNRREPEEGESHQTIATTSYSKRNPKATRHNGSTQSIHIQVGGTWYAFLKATTKSRWILVG
jgi:hypothetical protein